MVSFSCEVCNDTIIKKKLDQHTQRCYGAYFSCIDCSTTFEGTSYRNHTSCISEAEKYEKALYKGPKKKQQQQQKTQEPKKVEQKKEEPTKKEEPKKKVESKKKEDKKDKTNSLHQYLTNNKTSNLYKILKKASNDDSKKLKQLLKKIEIIKQDDNKLIIQLD